jgi:hypothetical protein
MKAPSKLYRYRPLDDTLLERELSALRDSVLFSPPFAAMNDPMEAFYETGGPGDRIIDAMLGPAGKSTRKMYDMLSEMIHQFALISFASSYRDLPMWAYYGSNFGGMCLEFEAAEFEIGDLQGENLRQVTYARTALPPLTLADMAPNATAEAVIARMTRKRVEWAHEKEWRFITGRPGPKCYLDDTLLRVFLGPRVKAAHADRVCAVLDRRPVEVLQGKIEGFELRFESIKPAQPLESCDRVGAGRFDLADHLYAAKDLEQFLEVPMAKLLEECRRTTLRPNMEEFSGIDLTDRVKDALYIRTTYKLRSGREAFHKRYFDRRMRAISGID